MGIVLNRHKSLSNCQKHSHQAMLLPSLTKSFSCSAHDIKIILSNFSYLLCLHSKKNIYKDGEKTVILYAPRSKSDVESCCKFF